MADTDFKSAQRIRIWDVDQDGGSGLDVNVEMLHSEYKTALSEKVGALPIAGRYATGTDIVAYDSKDAVPLLTDVNGRLAVILSGSTVPWYVDDSNGFSLGSSYVTAIGGFYDADGSDTVDDNDIGIPRISLHRKLLVSVSGNDNANSETNPIFTHEVAAASGQEIHAFYTFVVNKGALNDTQFLYPVPPATGDKFLLKSVIVSASGVLKGELWVGPSAGLVEKAVVFTTGSKLTEQIYFDPPIEILDAAGGEEALMKITTDDNKNMSVYVTFIGSLLLP